MISSSTGNSLDTGNVHTHTTLILFFSPLILMSDLQNAPEGGARFVPSGPSSLQLPDLTVLETLSPASSL